MNTQHKTVSRTVNRFCIFSSNPNKLYIIGKEISREIQWHLNQLNSSKYSRDKLFWSLESVNFADGWCSREWSVTSQSKLVSFLQLWHHWTHTEATNSGGFNLICVSAKFQISVVQISSLNLKPKLNKKVPRKIFMYCKADTDSFSVWRSASLVIILTNSLFKTTGTSST